MYTIEDVRTEVRKLVDSKAVHAAAGVGVIASETLRELPNRIARLRDEATVAALPARATEYVMVARAKAVEGYDKLALRGQQALSARNGSHPKAKSKASGAKSRATGSANGKAS